MPSEGFVGISGRTADAASSAVERAIDAIAAGAMALVLDDRDRENEADLVMAAAAADASAVGFMVRHTSGVICASMPQSRLDELRIPPMVMTNSESRCTAFTVSVDLREGTTSGISAADRSRTLRALGDRRWGPDDFARPGHVFPLTYRDGGVLARAGHTEAALDLVRLAGRGEVAVLSEVVREDGSMLSGDDAYAFAATYGIPALTIAELTRYRLRTEVQVQRVATARVPTEFGDFTVHMYESLLDGTAHVAAVIGGGPAARPVLCRVHSECFTGDVLGSLRCDCGEQLDRAIRRIGAAGSGVLVYLGGHEGRGIGLAAKLRAYALQDQGRDTVEANVELGYPVDSRDYAIAAHILRDLGTQRIRLMTNNPAKCTSLTEFGIDVVERVELSVSPNSQNQSYLETKRRKLGHLFAPATQGRLAS